MKFKKKPIEVEANQWFKNGDNPLVISYQCGTTKGERYCGHCGKKLKYHGWIWTLEGGFIVCPGDWIITGLKGESYPCKPDIFDKTYDKVEE